MEKKLEDDVVLDFDGVYSEISMQDFTKAIGGQLQVILVKNERSHEVKTIVFEIIFQEKNDS